MTDEEIIKQAREAFKRCEEWEAVARQRFVEDVKFGNADSRNGWQWSDALRKVREADHRPMLTINKTQVHCLQIVNDARQNKAGIEIRPVGNEATQEAAEIQEGIIRHIEYASNAQIAYDTAMWNAVFGGIGYVRVHVDYEDEDSFDQAIFIKRVANPLNIYLDPDIQQYDGSDARFGFVFEDLPRKEAEEKYGKDDGELNGAPLDGEDAWNTKDHVRVCEYFYKGDRSDTLIQTTDGAMGRESELPEGVTLAQMKAAGIVVQTRKISVPAVNWCMIVGDRIAAKRPWPGKYVPIARVVGQELVVDGQLDRKGHVRCLIDPQNMYNYNSSGSVEFVGLQSKTPYIAAVAAIENYKEVWSTANTTNHPVLPYNHVDDAGNPIPKPERQQPPVAAGGHIEGMQVAQQEMMLVSGQYQAVMGAPSNETSGKAINARQRQGDNATYHFIDHQAQAIRFIGRICLDLIPKIYDTQRVLQVLGRDETLYRVQIEPGMPNAAQQQQKPGDDDFDPSKVAAALNPSVGKYDVISDIGPSYATQRQEAFNAFGMMIQQNPDAFRLMADLYLEAADFPGAEKAAKRLKAMLPQQANGGPSPEMQQMQQQFQQMAQQGHAEIGQLHEALKAAQQKLSDQTADLERKDFEAETNRMRAVGAIDPEALKPVIREMVSQLMGEAIVPLMHQHAQAEQAMLPQPQPMEAGVGAQQ